MTEFGRTLIILGAIIAALGLVLLVTGRLNLPLGRLPGDISWRSKSGNSAVYFPIVTCVVASLLLSLVHWIVNSFRR